MSNKTQNLMAYLQGHTHSIDVLLAIYCATRAKGSAGDSAIIGWRDMEQYFIINGIHVSGGAYRARRRELAKLGLIELKPLDPLKDRALLTTKGRVVAELLIVFEEKIRGLPDG